MRSDLWIRAALLAALGAASACDSGGSSKKADCKDDATQSCTCDAGGAGEQTCTDGKFGACVCGAGGDSALDGGGLGNLKGRVFDADTGRPVENAEIKARAGGSTVKSDAKGNFELDSEMDPEELVVSAKSYAGTVKRAPEKAGYIELYIEDVDESVEFAAEEGKTLKLKSGASVDVPPGAVIDAEGKRVAGMVKLTVADVDGAERKQSASLPRDFKAVDEGGTDGRVAVYRALEISIVDKDGKALNVSAESKVVAEFPAKDADGAAERGAFSYDEKTAKWVQEGKVKRSVNDKGERVYRKDVDHLSWHGYGDFFAKVTCLKVCVEDAAKKAQPYAQVWLVGASFPGASSVSAGQDGCAVGDVPTEQEVVLVGQNDQGVSKPASYKSGADEASAATDPTQCDDGAAALVIGESTASDCPAGFAESGQTCVDIGSDPQNCGTVGNVCPGSAGREQSCIAGKCGCPQGTTACGDDCVNTDTDSQNCGGCDNDVTEGGTVPATCVAGQLLSVNCGSVDVYTRFCGNDCVDTAHNEANCGECGKACAAGQVCLDSCKDPTTDVSLCSSPNPMYGCNTTNFCYGVEICNPDSPQAYYNGCVPGPRPCTGIGICDAQAMDCTGQCVPKTLPGTPPAEQLPNFSAQCSSTAILGCLVGNETGKNLGTAIACGEQASATPVDPPADYYYNEFGYDGNCADCLRIDLMKCGKDTNNCDAQVDALYCCSDVWECSDQACLLEHCQTEFDAVDTCLDSTTCYSDIKNSLCFGG